MRARLSRNEREGLDDVVELLHDLGHRVYRVPRLEGRLRCAVRPQDLLALALAEVVAPRDRRPG